MMLLAALDCEEQEPVAFSGDFAEVIFARKYVRDQDLDLLETDEVYSAIASV